MKRWFIALAALIACAGCLPAHAGMAGHGTAGACPQGGNLGDGCPGAPLNGSFQEPDFFNTARQSGQTYVTRPPWNVAGVDYAVGYNTATTLADPSTATHGTGPGQLPVGCTYAATGGTGGGPRVLCKSNVSPSIRDFDFSLHGCIQLTFANTVTGEMTVANNYFKNGPGCNALNGSLVNITINNHANLLFVGNHVDGGFPDYQAALSADVLENGSGVGAGCSIVFQYNVFINSPQIPIGGKTDNCTVDVSYNYFAAWVMSTTLLPHGAIFAMNHVAGQPANGAAYTYNTGLYPASSPSPVSGGPGQGSTVFSFLGNTGGHTFYAYTTVDHNTVVNNRVANPTTNYVSSVALSFIDHPAGVVNATITNNYIDPYGALTCLSNLGDASGVHGSVSGNTLTVTGSFTGAIYEAATFGGTGLTQAVIQPYGTSGTTGTGRTGTYILSGGPQTASGTNWQTFNTPITGTTTVSGNVNMLDGSAVTIGGVQWTAGQCNGHF